MTYLICSYEYELNIYHWKLIYQQLINRLCSFYIFVFTIAHPQSVAKDTSVLDGFILLFLKF